MIQCLNKIKVSNISYSNFIDIEINVYILITLNKNEFARLMVKIKKCSWKHTCIFCLPYFCNYGSTSFVICIIIVLIYWKYPFLSNISITTTIVIVELLLLFYIAIWLAYSFQEKSNVFWQIYTTKNYCRNSIA